MKKAETRFLHVSRLRSIKTKIIVLAMLATIVPCVMLGALSYIQNRKFLQEKIATDLRNASLQTAGEMQLWLKARFYDLKVFSSSYTISENLQQILDNTENHVEKAVAINRVKAYLASVREKFTDYQEWMLTISVGVAQCKEADDSVEAVLRRADDALYRAKAIGRNQVIGP